jgi:hypothetical protein
MAAQQPQQQPEVVIRADDGTEHVFPPGFDPKRAASIVRERAKPSTESFVGPRQPTPPEPRGRAAAATALFDVTKGAGKEALRRVHAGGEYLRERFPVLKRLDVATPDLDQALQPTNRAQRFGVGVERTAEFFVPAGLATKAAGAVKLAGAAPRAVAGVESALQGLGAYGTAKAQGDPHPGTAGVVAALGPVAGQAFNEWAPKAAAKARAIVENVLTQNKLGDRAQVGAARKVVSDVLAAPLPITWTRWLAAVGAKKAGAGARLEAALNSPLGDIPLPLSPIDTALDRLYSRIGAVTAPIRIRGRVTGVTQIPIGPRGRTLANVIEKMKDTFAEHRAATGNDFITTRELVKMKQAWDAYVFGLKKWMTQTERDQLRKAAESHAADAVRGILRHGNPTISRIDRQYHLSRTLFDLIEEAADTRPGYLAHRAAWRIGATAGGGAAGATLGHSTLSTEIGAALGYATTSLLQQAMAMPGFKLLPAFARDRLAKAIVSRRAGEVRQIVLPLLTSAAAGREAAPGTPGAAPAAATTPPPPAAARTP